VAHHFIIIRLYLYLSSNPFDSDVNDTAYDEPNIDISEYGACLRLDRCPIDAHVDDVSKYHHQIPISVPSLTQQQTK